MALAWLDYALPELTLAAALGCGLMAGVFFAFSSFIMKALARLPQGEGIAAMQSINVTVINPWFLGVFFGTGALCAVLVVMAFLQRQDPASVYLIAGGVLYLVGTFLVTLVFNVPRNHALAQLARADTRGSALWPRYLAGWTAWNHVRTVAALAAAASFSLGL